jgi:hypothetical protein
LDLGVPRLFLEIPEANALETLLAIANMVDGMQLEQHVTPLLSEAAEVRRATNALAEASASFSSVSFSCNVCLFCASSVIVDYRRMSNWPDP